MTARALTSVAVVLLALTACGGGNSDEPTAKRSSPTDEASVNAPLVPSPTVGSASAAFTKGAVPVPKTSGPRQTRDKPVPGPLTAAPPLLPPPPPPPDNLGLCSARQLTIRVIHQPPPGAGAGSALVVMANTGSRVCALNGWPKVQLIHAGRDLHVRTENVNKPGPPIRMSLAANRSAFVGLRWKTCAPTATTCRTGTSLRITAPGARSVDAKLLGFASKELSMSSVEVGAIRPTTVDILNW